MRFVFFSIVLTSTMFLELLLGIYILNALIYASLNDQKSTYLHCAELPPWKYWVRYLEICLKVILSLEWLYDIMRSH